MSDPKIGGYNYDILEAIVLAHIEHGSPDLHESVMLDVPTRMFTMYEGAKKDIESAICEIIFRERKI